MIASERRSILLAALIAASALVVPGAAAASQVLGDVITVSALDNQQSSPAVAYNPLHDEYLVVWENEWPGGSHDIYAQRVAGDGTLLSWFAVAAVGNDRVQPDVAYDPTHDRYLVVWSYDYFGDGSDFDVYGRFIPWSGPDAGLTEFSICPWTSSESRPRIALGEGAGEFMVVWMSTGPPSTIGGRRVLADGSGFASNPWEIEPFAFNRTSPDLTYNPWSNEYLVVWDVEANGELDVHGVLMTWDGTPLANFYPAVFFGIDESRPAITVCGPGADYVVAYEVRNGAQANVQAIRFTASSAVVIQDTSANEIEPDVACIGELGQWMVTWQQQYSSLSGPYGVGARTVDGADAMGAVWPLMAPTAGITAEFTRPTVAVGGLGYLVAWEHDRAGTSYQDIHAMFVRPNLFADDFESASTAAWPHVVP